VVVGGLKGYDITLPHLVPIQRTGATPRKPLAAEPHDKKIRHHSGVPAIAVGEGMDLHKPVMEAHGDLIRRIRLVFDPRVRVAKQLA
jgi:hypothetical protein